MDHVSAFERMQERFVPSAIKSINKAIDKQIDEVAKAVEAGQNWVGVVERNDEAMIQAYREIYTEVFPYFAGEFYNAVEDQVKDFDERQMITWIALVEDWLSVAGAQKVVQVNNHTKSVIADIIANAYLIDPDTGAQLGRLSALETSRLIREKFSDMKAYRAERIARTEINSAANWGHDEGAKAISADTGLQLSKTWMAVADNRTRDTHSRIDGETVRDDETFSNGLRFPGDPMGPANEIIMCRCTFVHEVIQ